MSRLNEKVAVVTGAASGIGYAITKTYIEEGAKVVATDVSENIHRLTEEFGNSVLPMIGDVSNENDVVTVIHKGIEHFGKIDILVNNAGIGLSPFVKVHELPTEDFKKILDVNILGQFYAIKYIIPHFLKNGGGCIINLSSLSAYSKYTTSAAYCVSKAAVNRLTESAAYDYAQNNIRVNAIAPGFIDTPIYNDIEEFKNQIASSIAVKRLGKSEEIASVAVFLATDDSSYVTGQTIKVDGGFLLE
jgi:NAD(P)-dependent dehydrogenase (short-subunit alcohol dehydrogenase family)